MKKFSMYQVSRKAFPDRNPDWQTPYNHIANWTDEHLAFEFLRRSPSYWSLVEQLYPPGKDHTGWPSNRLERHTGIDIDQQTYDKLMKRAGDEFGLWRCCDPRLPIAGERIRPWTVAASISSRYEYAVHKAAKHDHMRYRFGRHTPLDTITI